MRRLTSLTLLPLLALLAAGCGGSPAPTAAPTSTVTADVINTPPPASPVVLPVSARPGPGDGVLVGVNLDWGNDTPAALAGRLGRMPAAWVQFTRFPLEAADATNLDGYFDAVASVRGLAVLILEPMRGLAAVTDEAIDELVARLTAANRAGVPVLVRFAHEMNGSWYPWGEQPLAYVEAFRRVAAAVHAGAPGSAMLWAPNEAAGYPYAGGRHEAQPGTAEFGALDTDGDGRLSMADDPYGPYYPGDDAVDWVGMSIYHWGETYPWGENVLPETGKFAAKLTGTSSGAGGDERSLPDFYEEYAVRHDKPMAIPETAAFYRPSVTGGPSELAIKQAWWSQVFSADTLEQFPRIRLIDWFEWTKHEAEVDDVVDWRVSGDPELARAFLDDLPEGFEFAGLP